VLILFANEVFAGEDIPVKNNFDEYQQFLRHTDTHFFVEDGLPWDRYELFIRQGEVVPNGCQTSSVTKIPPGSKADSVGQPIIAVEQAVNGVTCQSLIKRGYLLPGAKLPSAKSPSSLMNSDAY
jgi:hypothetical protein